MIEKRFPADYRKQEELKKLNKEVFKTFLNDKKVDGELYAYFQEKSIPYQVSEGIYETRVYKEKLPSVAEIVKNLKFSSRTTYYTHLKYLIEQGFITEFEDWYVLDNKEDFYLMIPLETLRTILVGVSQYTIKTYIYLGTMWKLNNEKNFHYTYKEIAEHIGMKLNNCGERYDDIKRVLNILNSNGLVEIDFENKEILNFSTQLNGIFLNIKAPIKTTEKPILDKPNGYVYLIEMAGFYKIGITKNPKGRFYEYTKLPMTSNVLACEYCKNYKKLEKELHQKYQIKNTNGEWFSLASTDIEEIISIMKLNTIAS